MNFQIFVDNLIAWAFTSGIKVVVILIIAWIVSGLAKLSIKKLLKNFTGERLKTLAEVSHSIVKTIIWIIAFITILPEFGVNIAPLLAGLGVLGLALGFGARSLVADYISGIFILIEDQYRLGETIEIDGVKGKVRGFNLRRTIIENENKVIVYIPNSQIKKASNFSRN